MKNNKKGFSLIEVIVALVLFTIVFVSLMQLMDATVLMQQRTKRRENMTAIALSVYETFLLDPRTEQFIGNLQFIYEHVDENLVDENLYIYIFFNSDWKSVEAGNHKYYAIISVLGEVVPEIENEDNFKLYNETCKIAFYDHNDTLLLEKDPITTYVLRSDVND